MSSSTTLTMLSQFCSSKRTQRNFSKERNKGLRKNVPPKLDKSQIRLVICAGTEQGRTPYFDSNTIGLVEESRNNGIKTIQKTLRTKAISGYRDSSESQHGQTPKYHFEKLGSDFKVLTDMMFGKALEGLTLQVHLLRSPPQLMVSNVFIPGKPNVDGIIDAEPDCSDLSSFLSDLSSGEYGSPIAMSPKENVSSIPVDIPPNDEHWSDISLDHDSGRAYFSNSGSLTQSNSSIVSYNSLHKQWMRVETPPLNKNHIRDNSLPDESSQTHPQQNKLAFGFIFGSHDEKDEECTELFQRFFFTHFALIEGHVDKLRCVIEKAYFNSKNFLPAVMEALYTFRNDICDLYMAPRLQEPVWLTMLSTTTYKTVLFERFMKNFMWLVTKYNTKSCKFFVSTLLSAVLTHHLAWVATVTPAAGTRSNTYRDKHTAQWDDTLTKSHPYNPMWAQLRDLLGAVGCKPKISRTVVIGKRAKIVERLLYVLSYFIRCSEVQENTDLQCLNIIVNGVQFESSLSHSPSVNTLTDRQEESPTSRTYGAALSRQTDFNNSCTNHKLIEKKRHFSETRTGDEPPEDGSHSLKCCSKPVTSHQTESTINNQNRGHLGNQSNAFTSIAADTVGMSDLYIFTPSYCPCSLTSAKPLNPQTEQSCLVSRATHDTDNASKDFVPAEPEQISSLCASEVKTVLTQQLDEAKINGSNADNKLMTSARRSPVLCQSQGRKKTDTKSKLQLPKQTNQDARTSADRSSMLTRNRSTSSEFNKRRNMSSTGNIDYETFDPLIHCTEISIPDSLPESGRGHVQAFDRNFGHSLMAGYSDHYMHDFVLQGTSDTNCKSRLLNDLQMSVRHSALDEPIDEAVSIIASTDNWTVEVASSKVMGISPSGCTTWTTSPLVANFIESVVEIFKLKKNAEFCMMHLKDKLQEIYYKSVMLSEKMQNSTTAYSQQEITDILGCNPSDIPLLLAVAGTLMPKS